jgi:hypothetical protein
MTKKDKNTLLVVGAAVAAGLFFLLRNNISVSRSSALPLQPASAGLPVGAAAPISSVVQSVLTASGTVKSPAPDQIPVTAPIIDIVSQQPIQMQYLTV